MQPTFSVGDTVLYIRSTGEQVLATILGPSSDGLDYLTISYLRNGSMVTHSCARVGDIRPAFIQIGNITVPRDASRRTPLHLYVQMGQMRRMRRRMRRGMRRRTSPHPKPPRPAFEQGKKTRSGVHKKIRRVYGPRAGPRTGLQTGP